LRRGAVEYMKILCKTSPLNKFMELIFTLPCHNDSVNLTPNLIT